MNDLTYPKSVRLALILVAVTVVLSLLYAAQHFLGGPLELTLTQEINDIALSPGRSQVAAAVRDGSVRLWQVPSRLNANPEEAWPMRELLGHTSAVVSVAYDPRGATLYSASRDGTVRTWDVKSGQVMAVLDAPTDSALVASSLAADGSILAAIGADEMLHVWQLSSLATSATGEIGSAPLLQSIGPLSGSAGVLALSPDGRQVAVANGANIQIWDTQTGELAQELQGYWEDETEQEDWLGHTADVTALAFSPDGSVLASGSEDKTIVFWELPAGEVNGIGEGHFAAITALVFDEDGRTVLSGSSDNKAKTWRVPGGKVSGTYVGHLSIVRGVAFGPDRQSVLTGARDGTLRQWDVVNTSETHIEWTRQGLQPEWGTLFNVWMPLSGLLGAVFLAGMWRSRGWSHLLTLALFIIGPIVVLGLPLFEIYFYPFSIGTRLQIAWPLLLLGLLYALLDAALLREPVVVYYAASPSAPLAEKLMASQRTRRLRMGLFIGAVWVLLLVALYSILRQFNLDLAFMGHFFEFIMEGAWLTFRISALSILLAVVLALFGALGRLSNNPIANGVSGFYISLIRGTPLLVQIYIWYLGLPRLDIILPAEVAGILALGVNYGAYMTEIFRAGIQAIGSGQHEAAMALGMTRTQTLRRIVLPQAFRIVIPPIGNDFIAMMKDSSLVSIMAVWELSFRAQKIGRQYFRSLETFMIAAAFYWILTVVFQFLQGKLEAHMARGDRPTSMAH